MKMTPNDALMDEAASIIPEAFDGAVEGVIGLRFTDGGWSTPFLGSDGESVRVYVATYDGTDIAISPFVVADPELDKMLAAAKATRKDSDTLPKPQPL
jgi:hypothetical protein